MKCEGHRHEISGVVEQIDDCIRECHGEKAVINFETIIEDANHDAANREQQIGVLFREGFVIVEKAAVRNHDWISWEKLGKINKNVKIDKIFFLLLNFTITK